MCNQVLCFQLVMQRETWAAARSLCIALRHPATDVEVEEEWRRGKKAWLGAKRPPAAPSQPPAGASIPLKPPYRSFRSKTTDWMWCHTSVRRWTTLKTKKQPAPGGPTPGARADWPRGAGSRKGAAGSVFHSSANQNQVPHKAPAASCPHSPSPCGSAPFSLIAAVNTNSRAAAGRRQLHVRGRRRKLAPAGGTLHRFTSIVPLKTAALKERDGQAAIFS